MSAATVGYAQSPTTRPADGKILILPFTALNPSEGQPWLGRSIQQSVLADLTSAAPGRLLSSDAQAPDSAAAVQIAHKAGAAYVVQGSFTTLATSAGEGLRITGQVIEVDGQGTRAITAFKATGLYGEIFRLEDQVATQIRLRLAASGVLSATVQAPQVSASQLSPSQQTEDAAAELPQVNEYYQAYGSPQPSYAASQGYYNYYYADPYASGYGYGVGLGWPFLFGGAYYVRGSNFGGFGHGGSGGNENHHGGGAHGGGSGHGHH